MNSDDIVTSGPKWGYMASEVEGLNKTKGLNEATWYLYIESDPIGCFASIW